MSSFTVQFLLRLFHFHVNILNLLGCQFCHGQFTDMMNQIFFFAARYKSSVFCIVGVWIFVTLSEIAQVRHRRRHRHHHNYYHRCLDYLQHHYHLYQHFLSSISIYFLRGIFTSSAFSPQTWGSKHLSEEEFTNSRRSSQKQNIFKSAKHTKFTKYS